MNGLKATTRKQRGEGIRRKVANNSQQPKNWYVFLRIDESKSGLFHFLSNAIAKRSFDENKLIICASDETVICNQLYRSNFIVPCTQEGANTRVFLHVQVMSRQGIQSIKIRPVDTDVVVIALALLSIFNLNKLWIEFGTENNESFYPVNLICNHFGSEKCNALLFFMH